MKLELVLKKMGQPAQKYVASRLAIIINNAPTMPKDSADLDICYMMLGKLVIRRKNIAYLNAKIADYFGTSYYRVDELIHLNALANRQIDLLIELIQIQQRRASQCALAAKRSKEGL